MNFLILPVQRLPRYVLLLKVLADITSPNIQDLLKHTDESHEDFEILSKAVEKVLQLFRFLGAHLRR